DELIELSSRTGDQVGAVLSDRARRLFFAARSRLAEDTIAAAVATGARQVVILGAGLDTFAYRNPIPDLRVFELDHPATQAWKR
ncbi:class I SAM-dependent methyltransferase, partial [Mycolicibacterium elephantis]